MEMNNFALIGAAGFIAPRHIKAIHETGNKLVAALDPHDSVGILDRWFPDAAYFREPERFDRYLEKCRRQGDGAVDYVSICSPNYLHDAHIRMALRVGADAICEKPLVLNPWNLDALRELESETGRKVWTILQLREHPTIINLKQQVEGSSKHHTVNLTYIAPRGNWYQYSWKGNFEKSGGIAANIGVHFFDMLHWIFGKRISVELSEASETTCAGRLQFENAEVDWLLSIDPKRSPHCSSETRNTALRTLLVDDEVIDFSTGFEGLHSTVYQKILEGNGFGIEDTRDSIETLHEIAMQHNRLEAAHE